MNEKDVTIPFSRAALCFDCEAVFNVENKECPWCCSKAFGLLISWLGRKKNV
jgi:RNA polymerase subunit RPABC4/transcription elongation factor Spt4